jgi:hypothetical protein
MSLIGVLPVVTVAASLGFDVDDVKESFRAPNLSETGVKTLRIHAQEPRGGTIREFSVNC